MLCSEGQGGREGGESEGSLRGQAAKRRLRAGGVRTNATAARACTELGPTCWQVRYLGENESKALGRGVCKPELGHARRGRGGRIEKRRLRRKERAEERVSLRG